jgi:hypothetical protein
MVPAAEATGTEPNVSSATENLGPLSGDVAGDQEHHPECPLAEVMKGEADNVIYEVAHYGRQDGSARLVSLVMGAIARCESCRKRFQEYIGQRRSEEYSRVQEITGKIAHLRSYEAALEAGCVWFTEDIEEALATSPRLCQLNQDSALWSGLFHAFVNLMYEACDVRHPELPFVSLGIGLIPKGWKESDVVDYITGEVELDVRPVKAGLMELEKLIRAHSDKALEPLGWFVPNDSSETADLYMIGWEKLLEPRSGDIGVRSRVSEQENGDPGAYSLSKEHATSLERIREAARKSRNVTV